ncbi:MAG: phosphocholine cytidylyltransferase family protein [Candidatus Thermoplasmatota archaeon]
MDVVILAAGRGERLWPLTRSTPKCLLEIGEGVTLLESQLLTIRQVPALKRVLLVVGYLAEQIEAKLRVYERGTPIVPVYNPFYATSNNLVSLWLAMPHAGPEFVVVNGDNIFRSDLLARLLSSPARDEVVMVVDRKPTYSEDDMKVVTSGGLVHEVGKTIPPEKTNGESIGMILFRGRGAVKLREILDTMVRTEAGRNAFWLAAVQELVDSGFPAHFLECSPDEWAEMDYHPDREIIRANIGRFAEHLLSDLAKKPES